MSDDSVNGWTLTTELGSGHFAKVKLATRSSDGQKAACKIIKKPKGSKMALVDTEVAILKEVNHPYIVRCYEAFDSPEKMYLMLELCSGGELFDRIVDKGHFTEADCQEVTAKLLGALKYLHDKGIAHRDLKPENMLMSDKTDKAEVKITDFGLSKFFDEQSTVMKTPCGTPGYIAPEVLQMKGYGKECDIWSLGVIVYILLCGFPPFYADNDAKLFEKIKKGEYQFLRPYWDPISQTAKDLVSSMLTVDPKKRPTADQCLEHPFLKQTVDKLGKVNILGGEMKEFNAKRKLKGAFMAAKFMAKMELKD